MTDPNAIRFCPGEETSIHSLVDMFETSDSLNRIYIPTDDTEGTYGNICREFKEVDAGGGLVSNRRGDFLLIRRSGLWDLPKGHREEGEDIKVTALREVQEETGVDKLKLGELICITDHCYRRNGLWHLKHTWWFDMKYTDPVNLTPQREEDITKVGGPVQPSRISGQHISFHTGSFQSENGITGKIQIENLVKIEKNSNISKIFETFSAKFRINKCRDRSRRRKIY